jgi:hypothetical protein
LVSSARPDLADIDAAAALSASHPDTRTLRVDLTRPKILRLHLFEVNADGFGGPRVVLL